MKVYSLFELFLTAFAFYAILEFEGDMRIVISSLCLLTSFLFGRLRTNMKDKEGNSVWDISLKRSQYVRQID